eukprot:scaffold22143_cov41-Cyclotella_meneghiniana.AAC.1
MEKPQMDRIWNGRQRDATCLKWTLNGMDDIWKRSHSFPSAIVSTSLRCAPASPPGSHNIT